MKTHYKVLGVSRKASDETIKTAFRKAVKRYHPDINRGDTRGEAQLRRVLAAYEMLKKPGRRIAYDHYLRTCRRERVRTFAMTAGAGLGSGSFMMALLLVLTSPQHAAAPLPTTPVAVAAVTAHAQISAQQAIDNRHIVSVVAKSDRVATASKVATVSKPVPDNEPQQVRQAANNTHPTADHAKPKTRLAREWKQVRASGDPKAILAFAARNPDASEAELARSKLIAVIDSAQDVALLNVLGLGNGAIAERAQQRLHRLRPAAVAKEAAKETPTDSPADTPGSLKERAAGFVTARISGWASINAGNLAAFGSAYADKVHYYGSRKSRHAILLDKRRFLERWPERLYEVRPGSITVHCAEIVCKVGGLVDWQARNAARAKSASGVARFEYEIAVSDDGFRILSESGSDVKRPRQASTCLKIPPGGLSASVSEIRRQAARCLQLAHKTSLTKQKSVLLARAQAWKQRAEVQEQFERRVAERWGQQAALRRTE